MKRVVSLVLILLILFVHTNGVYAANMETNLDSTAYAGSQNISDGNMECIASGDNELSLVIMDNEDCFISEESAVYIAKFFLRDMSHEACLLWDDNTRVLAVCPLFDSDGETITAYSIELSEGYIVISAWADVFPLIIEWSDSAEPLYWAFDREMNSCVVYGGGLDYFLDNGETTIQSLSGVDLDRNDMNNAILEKRNIDNIPLNVQYAIASYTQSQANAVTNDVPVIGDGFIRDPYAYAEALYGGGFTHYTSCNLWEAYATNYGTRQLDENDIYEGNCGPTAITNMICTYRKSLGQSISDRVAINMHEYIASYGIEHLYYYDHPNIGTVNASADEYIENVCSMYALYPTVTGQYYATYSNIKRDIDSGSLLYLMLKSHAQYGNHHVMAYAYTQLRHVSSNIYAEFLKICDGYSESGKRYIDVDVLTSNDKYWEVDF